MFAPFNHSNLPEALVLLLAVMNQSPGTAVAAECCQFRGWVVCVVTFSHLCLCWQAGFGVHCKTVLPLPRSMFHTLKILPHLRDRLVPTVQIEHYDDVADCFRPLQEGGKA